ncbi:hypothetical protein TBLA_0A06410 [Henningerozyma blattae CBS 6284]|uniref:Uncharacterized protein n=1 Tax=Henningerozyma blattae (strain ATCC 34711 / CBS 6284 / DSM 70876 / NBRC 10599 / NRRL Y-10934 / UCD 77-7) TaxID=1071380 RepID=I2GWD1_HENB6|nr:hypothetical protein TBLA_0A06410 [Tetrapisispora blattae CBS 6284]CCH58433.1 hypothetical protein TBLA_0A06410 [Tetrapisispora blattae CBS 6284]
MSPTTSTNINKKLIAVNNRNINGVLSATFDNTKGPIVTGQFTDIKDFSIPSSVVPFPNLGKSIASNTTTSTSNSIFNLNAISNLSNNITKSKPDKINLAYLLIPENIERHLGTLDFTNTNLYWNVIDKKFNFLPLSSYTTNYINYFIFNVVIAVTDPKNRRGTTINSIAILTTYNNPSIWKQILTYIRPFIDYKDSNSINSSLEKCFNFINSLNLSDLFNYFNDIHLQSILCSFTTINELQLKQFPLAYSNPIYTTEKDKIIYHLDHDEIDPKIKEFIKDDTLPLVFNFMDSITIGKDIKLDSTLLNFYKKFMIQFYPNLNLNKISFFIYSNSNLKNLLFQYLMAFKYFLSFFTRQKFQYYNNIMIPFLDISMIDCYESYLKNFHNPNLNSFSSSSAPNSMNNNGNLSREHNNNPNYYLFSIVGVSNPIFKEQKQLWNFFYDIDKDDFIFNKSSQLNSYSIITPPLQQLQVQSQYENFAPKNISNTPRRYSNQTADFNSNLNSTTINRSSRSASTSSILNRHNISKEHALNANIRGSGSKPAIVITSPTENSKLQDSATNESKHNTSDLNSSEISNSEDLGIEETMGSRIDEMGGIISNEARMGTFETNRGFAKTRETNIREIKLSETNIQDIKSVDTHIIEFKEMEPPKICELNNTNSRSTNTSSKNSEPTNSSTTTTHHDPNFEESDLEDLSSVDSDTNYSAFEDARSKNSLYQDVQYRDDGKTLNIGRRRTKGSPTRSIRRNSNGHRPESVYSMSEYTDAKELPEVFKLKIPNIRDLESIDSVAEYSDKEVSQDLTGNETNSTELKSTDSTTADLGPKEIPDTIALESESLGTLTYHVGEPIEIGSDDSFSDGLGSCDINFEDAKSRNSARQDIMFNSPDKFTPVLLTPNRKQSISPKQNSTPRKLDTALKANENNELRDNNMDMIESKISTLFSPKKKILQSKDVQQQLNITPKKPILSKTTNNNGKGTHSNTQRHANNNLQSPSFNTVATETSGSPVSANSVFSSDRRNSSFRKFFIDSMVDSNVLGKLISLGPGVKTTLFFRIVNLLSILESDTLRWVEIRMRAEGKRKFTHEILMKEYSNIKNLMPSGTLSYSNDFDNLTILNIFKKINIIQLCYTLNSIKDRNETKLEVLIKDRIFQFNIGTVLKDYNHNFKDIFYFEEFFNIESLQILKCFILLTRQCDKLFNNLRKLKLDKKYKNINFLKKIKSQLLMIKFILQKLLKISSTSRANLIKFVDILLCFPLLPNFLRFDLKRFDFNHFDFKDFLDLSPLDKTLEEKYNSFHVTATPPSADTRKAIHINHAINNVHSKWMIFVKLSKMKALTTLEFLLLLSSKVQDVKGSILLFHIDKKDASVPSPADDDIAQVQFRRSSKSTSVGHNVDQSKHKKSELERLPTQSSIHSATWDSLSPDIVYDPLMKDIKKHPLLLDAKKHLKLSDEFIKRNISNTKFENTVLTDANNFKGSVNLTNDIIEIKKMVVLLFFLIEKYSLGDIVIRKYMHNATKMVYDYMKNGNEP